MGAKDHQKNAEDIGPIRCAILVVSDTRTAATDTSGKLAMELFTKYGHTVVAQQFVPNKVGRITRTARALLKGEADVLLTIGGTGASRKDQTIEAVRPLLVKELPGFGELFRAKSVQEIGTAAILSRALMGVTKYRNVVVSTPGSEAAVRLALEGILLNELKHLVWELRRR